MTDRKERTNSGRFAKGNPGKPKGAQSHLTKTAKEAFQFAFDKIGGAENLAIWATENTTEFYKLFARLIPVEQQISGKDGKELNFTLFVPSKA
jgi:hypothetical protein